RVRSQRTNSWLCASLAYPGEARHKRVLTASGATATMQLLIQEVPATDAPIDLLLIADPSKDKVLSYLSRSRCFVASSEPIVGVCVVQPLGGRRVRAYEHCCTTIPPEMWLWHRAPEVGYRFLSQIWRKAD